MPTFESKYSDAQREAVAVAYLDRRIRPAQRVAELAARGDLEHAGESLPAFDIPAQSVRDYSARLRKARAGQLKSGLTDAQPRDAIETLRRRLVSASDHMLETVERRQRRNRADPKDPELLRQIARAVREIAAIPSKDDPRPIKPGQKIPGTQTNNGDRTSGGLAGTILAAHSGKGDVYTQGEDPQQSTTQDGSDNGERSATPNAEEPQTEAENGGPGSWMREEVGVIPG